MEKVGVSGALKIAFDVAVGVILLTLVAVFFGSRIDTAAIVLISLVVVAGTGLMVRQDSQILSAAAHEEDRA